MVWQQNYHGNTSKNIIGGDTFSEKPKFCLDLEELDSARKSVNIKAFEICLSDNTNLQANFEQALKKDGYSNSKGILQKYSKSQNLILDLLKNSEDSQKVIDTLNKEKLELDEQLKDFVEKTNKDNFEIDINIEK